jgi:hypothetical protein
MSADRKDIPPFSYFLPVARSPAPLGRLVNQEIIKRICDQSVTFFSPVEISGIDSLDSLCRGCSKHRCEVDERNIVCLGILDQLFGLVIPIPRTRSRYGSKNKPAASTGTSVTQRNQQVMSQFFFSFLKCRLSLGALNPLGKVAIVKPRNPKLYEVQEMGLGEERRVTRYPLY